VTKTLQQHLTDCLGDTRLHIGVVTRAVKVLTQALADDPSLTIEARLLIESGVPVEQRDHVARWRNSLLRQALDTAHVRDRPG